VSSSHDSKFFDTFMLVLGILFAITIGLIMLARLIAADTSVAHQQQDPVKMKEVAARIAPVARTAIAGQDNSALAPPAPVVAVSTTDLPGEQVFSQVCAACHGAGIAGAPKAGDKAAWAPRIAQGKDTLHKHAIEGYQGKAGYMPPKGGRADLSDQSIINAVDYIIGL
jgi:cytochrome c5